MPSLPALIASDIARRTGSVSTGSSTPMAPDSRSGRSAGWFLLGGLAGAFLGVILAPRRGVETRDLLIVRTDELVARASRLLDRDRDHDHDHVH